MTTLTAFAPRFETRNHHHGARALAIVALCAALAAGFVANTWRVPHAAPAADDVSLSAVACAAATSQC